jgi:response regulator of citrate/malate metabolism
MAELRVLVVEDDVIAAQAHRTYVERIRGFTCVGVVGRGGEALRALSGHPGHGVDLVLLDLHLPDGYGLDLVRRMRAAGDLTDVIAVTSAREVAAVQAAARIGVVQYVLKPFAFETFRSRLEIYASHRRDVPPNQTVHGQSEVDRLFSPPVPVRRSAPKGVLPEVLQQVVDLLGGGVGRTAQEVAVLLGSSRVTARRYLEHLADDGQVVRTQRHEGRSGRPQIEYTWVAERDHGDGAAALG